MICGPPWAYLHAHQTKGAKLLQKSPWFPWNKIRATCSITHALTIRRSSNYVHDWMMLISRVIVLPFVWSCNAGFSRGPCWTLEVTEALSHTQLRAWANFCLLKKNGKKRRGRGLLLQHWGVEDTLWHPNTSKAHIFLLLIFHINTVKFLPWICP